MENDLSVMKTSCDPTGTEGRCDIKATCMSIDIEDFSGKVEARNQLTFQGFRIDFFEADTTLGHKGLSQ